MTLRKGPVRTMAIQETLLRTNMPFDRETLRSVSHTSISRTGQRVETDNTRDGEIHSCLSECLRDAFAIRLNVMYIFSCHSLTHSLTHSDG
jgi:hypothetical protein